MVATGGDGYKVARWLIVGGSSLLHLEAVEIFLLGLITGLVSFAGEQFLDAYAMGGPGSCD